MCCGHVLHAAVSRRGIEELSRRSATCRRRMPRRSGRSTWITISSRSASSPRPFPRTHPFLGFEIPYQALIRPIPRAIWPGKPEGLSMTIEDVMEVEGPDHLRELRGRSLHVGRRRRGLRDRARARRVHGLVVVAGFAAQFGIRASRLRLGICRRGHLDAQPFRLHHRADSRPCSPSLAGALLVRMLLAQTRRLLAREPSPDAAAATARASVAHAHEEAGRVRLRRPVAVSARSFPRAGRAPGDRAARLLSRSRRARFAVAGEAARALRIRACRDSGFRSGKARCHWNWRLPAWRDFDILVCNTLLTSLTGQWLMRGAVAAPPVDLLGRTAGPPRRAARPALRPAASRGGHRRDRQRGRARIRARFPEPRVFNLPYHCDLAPFLAATAARADRPSRCFFSAGR